MAKEKRRISSAELEMRKELRRQFGRNLNRMLIDRGWNQSEFGRQIEEKCGQSVGRDRISRYVRGDNIPDPIALKQIADTLGVTQTELVGPADETKARGRTTSVESGGLEMRAIPERPGNVWLIVNQEMTMDQSVRIMQILAEKQEG